MFVINSVDYLSPITEAIRVKTKNRRQKEVGSLKTRIQLAAGRSFH